MFLPGNLTEYQNVSYLQVN